MAFEDSFLKIQQALKNAKGTAIDGHLAVEIVINDEQNAGIGYVEVADGQVRVEPYDYWDHDARLIGAAADLIAVFSGKVGFDAAIADNKLFFQGERALELRSLIRKPAGRKPAAKKVAESETVKTPATKGTSRKKAKPVKQDTVAADEP